jgi:hypothetical protein
LICVKDFSVQLLIRWQNGGAKILTYQRIRDKLRTNASSETIVQQQTVPVIEIRAQGTDELFRAAVL